MRWLLSWTWSSWLFRAVPLTATAAALALCGWANHYVDDSRDLRASRGTVARAPSGLIAQSAGVCSLIGPNDRNPGIWGTDLGYTARTRDAETLTVLFGDTWASPIRDCQYPGASNNDLQATLPAQRPVMDRVASGAASSCSFLKYEHAQANDVTSWPHIHLYADPGAKRGDPSLDLSGLRTPIAAFSDGARMMALFQRFDPVQCDSRAECPSGMHCSADPAYRGRRVGECTKLVELNSDGGPDYCRDTEDCVPGSSCEPTPRGVCLADAPFAIDTPNGSRTPSWYRDDPKRALASYVYVAGAIWPERPADYAVLARFATNRFQTATARTVAHFDPEHPELNDYRPGYHTLLIWGRNTFVESAGAQALPFLLYVPLDELRGPPEAVKWRPRFFAGFGSDGGPLWSERESDAKPIYGSDAQSVRPHATDDRALEWAEPEFDVVSLMSVSYVEPLSRWVMLYGGDLPAFMVLEPQTGRAREPVHRQWAPGAIHMRVAPHPWGAARIERHAAQPSRGWSSAEPILTREQAGPYLACGGEAANDPAGCRKDGDGFRPLALAGALANAVTTTRPDRFADVAQRCVLGELAREAQDVLSGDPIGRLYAPNIIDEWTHDVTSDDQRARGERSVDLYWNVSTWNPYQVVLFKTQLTGRAD